MKKTSKLNRFFRSFDRFGQPISLYIQGDTTYKTSFGGIITATILVIIMLISINSFINLINKTNMTSTKETTYQLNPPFLDLTQQNFMFSIGIGNKNIALNNSLFSYTASLITVDITNRDQKSTQITLRPCQYEDYNQTANEMTQTYLQNFLCPDNFSYGIYDFYPNPFYQFIDITINQCKNGTNPYITCASQEYIENYIKTEGLISVVLFFMNRIVDLQNVQNPFQTFTDLQYWIIDPFSPLYTTTNLYLRLNELTSYDDIFGISSPNKYNFITYEKERTDNALFQPTNSTITYAELSIYSSNYQNHYTRYYDNFLSVVSYIGGILNILSVFAGFIVGIYNGYKYKMQIFNEIYDFDLEKYISEKNYQLNLTKSKKRLTHSNKVHANSEFDTSIVNQKLEKMKNSRGRLIFTIAEFFQYIFYYSKSKILKAKMILFDLADNRFAKDIDIIWLIKRIRDIDKLKTILLYPDKLKIFEFIPPPIISTDNYEGDQHDIIKSMRKNTIINEETREKISIVNSDKINQKLDRYLECKGQYTKIKNEKNHISRNIISCLDTEIIQIFESIEETKNPLNIYQTNSKLEEIPLNKCDSDIFTINNLENNKPLNELNMIALRRTSDLGIKNSLLFPNDLHNKNLLIIPQGTDRQFENNTLNDIQGKILQKNQLDQLEQLRDSV